MILKYGIYAHGNNEATFTIDSIPLRTKSDVLYGFTQKWRITAFPGVEASTQAQLTQAIQALFTAYSRDGGDLVFYLDDGVTATAHTLYSAQTLSGTRVTKLPSFPQGGGAEYSTYRSYTIEVEADVPLRTDNLILSYEETTETEGTGGPTIVYIPVAVGPWVRQQTSEMSTTKLTQSGRATGLYGYPPPNPPLLPESLLIHHAARISQNSPRLRVNKYYEYPISWTYPFQSNVPIAAVPLFQPIQ
jgi:hypothetical protein